jgi:hypothetical protein
MQRQDHGRGDAIDEIADVVAILAAEYAVFVLYPYRVGAAGVDPVRCRLEVFARASPIAMQTSLP